MSDPAFDKLKAFVAGYPDLKSSKERACFLRLLDETLDKQLPPLDGGRAQARAKRKEEWLRDNVPGYQGNFKRYMALLDLKENADYLFELIDKGELSVNLAGEAVWEVKALAKKRKKEGYAVHYPTLISEVLAAQREGKLRRYGKNHSKERTSSEQSETKAFFREIRDKIKEMIHQKLADHADDIRAKRAEDIFIADIDAAFVMLSNALLRIKEDHQSQSEQGLLRSVRKACQLLQIDPPRPGKPIDLKRAETVKKRLVRAYHPDANSGDESMRDRFNEVIEAYQKCKQWNAVVEA